jgi:hypothetical protein
MIDGDGRAVVRQFREVLADGVRERELALLGKQQHGAAAVNCFETEPASKTESGASATWCSRSAMP